MAVTIHQQPQNWSTSDNPLTYVFSSNQTAQAKFSFIVETYFNGGLVDRRKVFPEVSTKAHWDCSEVISQRLTAPKLSTNTFTEAFTSGSIYVKIIENYGIVPENEAQLDSETTKVFKGCLPLSIWEGTDFTNYPLQKWLSDIPSSELCVLPNQNVFLSMITNGQYEVFVETFDSSGISIQNSSLQDVAGKEIVQLNLNTQNLIDDFGLTMINVAYFTVQINTSDVVTVKYIQEFCNQPNYVVWVNKYGAFDQYPILHNESKGGKIKEYSYNRQYGYWFQGSFVYDSTVSGDQNYFKTETQEGTLVTDYLTEIVQNWLTEIYLSPRVYVFNIANVYRLIKVINSSYDLGKQRFDELLNEEIKYRANNDTTSILL